MTLTQFSRFFLYLAAFSITIVLSSTFFPFIGGKYYFFRIMVELALMFAVFSWAFEQNDSLWARLKKVSREPLFIAVSVFVLFYMLATFFAYDPVAAFWSNFERGEGGFQMLHYYLFFVLALVLFDQAEHWYTMLKTMLAAAVLMIFYGIAAAGGWGDFVGPYRDNSGNFNYPSFWQRLFDPNQRFQGSLGNPAYVAPYLMFSMFYAAWLWVSQKSKQLKHHLIYGALIVFFFLFFILSQTRGAFIGLAAALLTFFLYLIFFGHTSSRVKRYILIGFAAFLLLGAGLFSIRTSPFVQKLPGARLIDFNLSADSFKTRLWTWGSAWAGFKDRPILGWGPENFSTVFDRHFNPNHYVPGQNTETWFDRAHSIIFDYLAETGILGFGAFVAIFIVFYYQFIRRFLWRKHDEDQSETQSPNNRVGRLSIEHSSLLKALLVAVPIGYVVQGLVLFDVLPIYINLFFVLALAVAILNHQHEHQL